MDESWATAHYQVLSGGMVSRTARLTRPDGATVVIKEATDAPPGLFAAEARGLALLERTGAVRVPRVIEVGEGFLILSDLGDLEPGERSWASLGVEVARLHLNTGAHFGLAEDNFLGRLPQYNQPDDDGHVFFARQRLLRYLDEPLVVSELTTSELAGLERLAERLSQLVPVQPASLLHGDLWHGNVIGFADAGAAVIDPACYYGWAEAELSMLWCCGRVAPSFWEAYQEVRPLDQGWQERMPLLHLREQLSVLAHFGAASDAAAGIRRTLDRYR